MTEKAINLHEDALRFWRGPRNDFDYVPRGSWMCANAGGSASQHCWIASGTGYASLWSQRPVLWNASADVTRRNKRNGQNIR